MSCLSSWRMRRLLVALLLLCLNAFAASGQGLSDWEHETPGGNTMGDAGSGIFLRLRSTSEELTSVHRWHFFKNHIIGEADGNFFVADESKGSLILFKQEKDYQRYLTQHSLHPTLWTRWHSDDWEPANLLIVLAILWFFVSIPVILSAIWIIYLILKSFFKLKHPLATVIIASAALLAVLVLSGKYPQSF